MKFIDSILNRITMYRVVLYYLIALLVLAAGLGALHLLPYSPVNIAFSVAVLVASAWITNFLCARIWKAVPSSASLYITALILALIMSPVAPTDLKGAFLLVVVSVWAMASKYIFAIRGKHLFNPAAFAVAFAALFLSQGATWWVAGNLLLMPVVVIGGLLIVRKIQRFDVVIAFAVASLGVIAFMASSDPLHAVWTTLIHSSFFFLALVMLTEPATMPPDRAMRVAYGMLVGIWFAPAMHIGSFYFTPELALLLGNLFVYAVSPKERLMLRLKQRIELAKDTYEFVFTPDQKLSFLPGQYLEWTLPEGKSTDSRGNRRYFTIASAPGEEDIHLGVKMTKPLSSFKASLLALKSGDTISAAQLAGDFTLPENKKRKLVFIAGGIGVTPFRSMIRSFFDVGARDAVLLYSNKTAEEIAYYDLFEEAGERLGLRTIYALTNDTRPFTGAYNGYIDAAFIKREIPDYKQRTFYISGPRSMVTAFQVTLRELGVSPVNIKSDYFPGFA